MSLDMLIVVPGGFDRTGARCDRWARDVGFGRTEVRHLAGVADVGARWVGG